MDCKDLERLLSTKRPDDLTPEDRDAVEAHLAECASCRETWSPVYESGELHRAVKELDTPRTVQGTVMARISGKASAPEPPEPEAPKQIGGYEVLGFVGRGGMGSVYKARQVSMDRLVALKILPARLASNQAFVERLTREARAAARLSHPNIVHAYDVGEADGHYYFAMEYIDGEGLDAVLRREGPLEQNRACRLMMQVASALTAAHEAGVIHRDIKPSNILLDRKGRARVADFGLAKRLEGDATTAAIGESLGTPAYAAPEVCAGRDIDARADLYSLGATFFHLLAGHPPFQNPDAAQVVVQQVKEQPPSLAEVAPQVDPRLCRIIDRLLRKDAEDRHPTARALLDELEALGELKPNNTMLHEAPTMPLSPGQKLLQEFEAEQRRGQGRSVGRRVALVGAAVAVAMAAVGLALWLRGRSAGPPQTTRRTGPATATAPEPTPQARREHNAQVVLQRAQRAAALGQWVTVTRELDLLAAKYADTQVCASNRIAIDELRAQAERELGGEIARPARVAIRERALVPGEWVSLFDGATLDGWRVVERFRVPAKYGDGRGGEVSVADGQIVLGAGRPATGIAWTGEFPRVNYEVAVEVMQTAKPDCFELVFPIGESHCQLEAGGFGGHVVGLSLVDDRWGTENPTTRHMRFERGKWYEVRLRVTLARIEAWIDAGKVVDLPTVGHAFSIASDRQPLLPFGISAWGTSAAVRRVRMRPLVPGAGPARPEAPGQWVSLFDGETLNGWQVLRDGGFAQGGPVRVEGGRLLLGRGAPRTGIAWTGDVPTEDYEIAVTARCEAGRDSFCGLYFPIGDSVCTLSVGGYGGRWFGLANVDDRNPTQGGVGGQVAFEAGRWYRIRLRVTKADVRGWVDDELVFDVTRQGHTFTPSLGDVPTRLAVVTWETSAGIKGIWMRRAGLEAPAQAGQWVSLFDGKTLDGWRVVDQFPEGIPGGRVFKGGEARVEDGNLVLERSDAYAGVACTRDVPRTDYELSLEAMRVEGTDCFCLVVFPVGEAGGDLEIGGWGGSTVGVGLVDGQGVPDNVTVRQVEIENGRWYTVRLRVGAAKVEAWLDEQKVVDLSTAAHTLSLFGAWQPMAPLGLGAARCQGTFRNIRYRLLRPEPPGRPGAWVSLFEPGALAGWEVVEGGRFANHGRVHLVDETVVLEPGEPATGILCRRRLPAVNYEVAFEVRRDKGVNHANVLFPVGRSHCILNLGGWDGDIVGLSLVDGEWAPGNGTARRVQFEPAGKWRWYRVRLRVTEAKVEAWLDDAQIVDLARAGRTLAAANWPEEAMGFALSTWGSRSAFRNIKVRVLGRGAAAAALPPIEEPGEWVSLFDGKTLDGWRVIERFPTVKPEEGDGTGGQAHVADGRIVLERGRPVSAIAWQGEFPRESYELSIEAMRVDGACDFCNLAFPVGDSRTTLCVGTWPNRLELRYLDGRPVKVDDRRKTVDFQPNRWYRVGVRVTPASIRVTLDNETLIDLPRRGLRFYTSTHHAELRPFGIGTWDTKAAFRDIRVRRLGPQPDDAVADEAFERELGDWVSLFDGESLGQWRAVERFPDDVNEEGDGAGGQVRVHDRQILIDPGNPLSGITWTGAFPTIDYEVEVVTRRVDQRNAFCNLIFPVGDSSSALYIGAKRGTVAGLFQVDGRFFLDGNVTTRQRQFEQGRWYRVRLRVTGERVAAWVDDERLFSISRAAHALGAAPRRTAPLLPFGIGTFNAGTALRAIRVRQSTRKPPPKLPDEPGEWIALFDGQTLDGWQTLNTGDYARCGQVHAADGSLVLGRGDALTGVLWRGDLPLVDYEVSLEARREPGSEAYWYLFFPTRDGGLRLDVGEWRGRLLGLTHVDGQSYHHNDTGRETDIAIGRWFRVRLRVTEERIEAWLDDDKAVDLGREGRRLTPPHSEAGLDSLVLGTCYASASFRNVRVQRLPSKPEPRPKLFTTPEEATVALSARDQWLDTGLYLREGKAYHIAATGRWGFWTTISRTADGSPRGAKHRPPHRGPMAYNLIGRVGPQGRILPIGSGYRVEPKQPGRLYLQMNDEYVKDNWGTLQVHVAGPLIADVTAPLLSRFTDEVAKLRVDARQDWTFSGVELRRGDTVLITAEGTCKVQPLQTTPDAWGLNKGLTGHRRGALLARIGEHGERLNVGTLHLLQAPEPGKLYLAVHDADRADNDGGYDVAIRAAPGLQPPAGERAPSPALRCTLVATLRHHDDPFTDVAFSPDGARLASCSPDGSLAVWDTRTWKLVFALGLGPLEALAFAPDSKRIAFTSRDRMIRLWDVGGREAAHTLRGHLGAVVAVGFFPDGKRLASASEDRLVALWDAVEGRLLGPLPRHDARPVLAVCPDGERLASATHSGQLRIWDATTRQCLRHVFARASRCEAVAWSPDGKRLATTGHPASVHVWDGATAEWLRSLDGPGWQLDDVAFSPDGKVIAACGAERTWWAWDATTYAHLTTIEGHDGEVKALAFSPDSKLLATASVDRTVQVWALELREGGEPEGAPPEP